MRIVHNEVKFKYTIHLFRKNKILNVYQLNTLNNVMFMHRISTKTPPAVFHPRFQRPSHSYPANFSESDYSLAAHDFKKGKSRASTRGPLLWNSFLIKTEKSLETMSLFKSMVKNKLLVLENEAKYFQ